MIVQDKQKIWSIDLCQDNLRDVTGATEAILRLKQLLADHCVSYTEQSCIHACRPCHAGALILRLDDELVTGATSEAVIDKVVALIKQG